MPRNLKSLRKAKKFLDNRFICLKYIRTFSNSLTTIFGGCVYIHISIPLAVVVKKKRSPKTFGIKTKRPP